MTKVPTVTAPPIVVVANEAIGNLNLEQVKDRLRKGGWTYEEAEAIEEWYKRFLKLAVKHSRATLIPSVPVEEFWRQHEQEEQYEEHCRAIFGKTLVRDAKFSETPEGVRDFPMLFAHTCELYRKEFGKSCMMESMGRLSEVGKSCRKWEG